jgi:quercetin dioxygenase-like cupin family protein
MKLHQWDTIEREQLNPHLVRQVIHGDQITVARLYLKKGAIVPRHSHANEQITVLQAGKLRFVFDHGETILEAGQALQIPGHEPHLVESLEDSVAMDLFSPVREDWIRGDDAYLRKL